ncbi:Translation initiation factor eIF2 gamma subunit [Spraguea lophii 42_110]|uniref:Eukaryotic translation initiation factor 2 subunit gamma n=1 Tax=Spraguea lophii (strain 42_110) TaxID=1358809 RepID=S7XU91_SPRLO|nr:Translation initiation factor eIF2 gamma subunit [Spraguea lophii 42_110]
MSNIISKQATINIGTIGHVAHGKSTVVRSITGVHTVRFKNELERSITIKLGYANAKIYECDKCPRPSCYSSTHSGGADEIDCKNCGSKAKLVKHVSFVDCPGHDVLMATMLNGTAIMDAALLLIAANEPCPRPQTQEHLFAVEIMHLEKFIIIQNKIDLITREQALEQYEQILEFLKTTKAAESPIVPASSQLGVNTDAILDFIVNYVPEPERTSDKDPKLVIIRSFDINKPGCNSFQLSGGVIGGTLTSGKISIGDEIEIRPGIIYKEDEKIVCRPFITKIVSLKTENNKLESAHPGGLIGVGTEMDPIFCKSDKLVGQVMGLKGKLPEIYIRLNVEYQLLKKISISNVKEENVALSLHENILLNVGSTTTGAQILELTENTLNLQMIKPVCCEIEERIAISKRISGHWRLIGYAVIKSGDTIEPTYY